MPLHVFSSTNLEFNKWNYQSMLWRNTKECVVSENSCSKMFVNFQEKHPMKLLFEAKLQVTWHLLGIFFWEIYEIIRRSFARNTRECRLLQLVSLENVSTKTYFSKNISFDSIFSGMCFQGLSMYNRCSRIKYLNKVYCYILNFYF